MNGDENSTALPTSCPHCSGTALYVRRLTAFRSGSPYFLDGLGEFFHYAHFDVVVCAKCGLTQFFAEPLAQRNVRSHADWRRIMASDRQADGPDPQGQDPDGLEDVSEPTLCLNCRSTIPAGADACPQCGWTYKPEG